MLEVKNLTKIYKTKGGAEVRALDDVSISFAEKGMVFLLGKSGSGKSTLLNMCGGLDSPDSGEIIVKGKSSKDFSAGDFDSYRNTYVGFIFQEYNILNEFSIEDNIALALELQGKPKDKQVIANLLDEVELTNFAKRKPNTLSGGQKQRVAIARALVKNPEIIMADEPTGALDSNTGKQVFDTLKKLSRDKLVIVVSHDRDFAEEYADRIIELKDGKVISDVIKTSIEAKEESKNVSLLQDNTLLIKSGVELTDKDVEKIKKIISSSKEDVLVTTNKEDISLFKKSAKINEDNSKECFVELKEQPQIDKPQEKAKFIRSKLKFKHAFKIGSSGIKTKPFRFILTLFLSTVAFIMFGLLTCLMYYDADKTLTQSLKDEGADYLNIVKNFSSTEEYHQADYSHTYTNQYDTFFDDVDCKELTEALGDDILKVYNINSAVINNLQSKSMFYTNKINGFIESSDKIEYIEGKAPQNNGEVAISEYLYDSIKEGKLIYPQADMEIKVNGINDIILNLKSDSSQQELVLKVSGVFKCDEVPEKFSSLKENDDMTLASKMEKILSERLLSYVVITPDSYELYKNMLGELSISTPNLGSYGSNLKVKYEYYSTSSMYYGKMSEINEYIDLQGNIQKIENVENKIILSRGQIGSFFIYVHEIFRNVNNLYPGYEEAVYKYYNEETEYNNMTINDLISALHMGICKEQPIEMFIEKYKVVYQFLQEEIPMIFSTLSSVDLKIGDNAQDFKNDTEVLGFAINNSSSTLFLSDDIYNDVAEYSKINYQFRIEKSKFDFENSMNGKYISVFASTNNSYDNLSKMVEISDKYKNDDSVLRIKSDLKSSVDYYSSLVNTLSKVFLWVGLALAVFSMLLLFNFIAASIMAKKKEIGILRAVGARGADVFKIFFVEAAILVIVCVILSILITGVMSAYINDTLASKLGITFSMFTFGFESIITIIAIAVVTAFVSTFIPVYNYARKKPVESIRAL